MGFAKENAKLPAGLHGLDEWYACVPPFCLKSGHWRASFAVQKGSALFYFLLFAIQDEQGVSCLQINMNIGKGN